MLFAVVEFDLLHSIDHLHDTALIVRRLLETFIVQFPALFQKDQNPACIQQAAGKKYSQYAGMIARHDNGIYDEGKGREDHADQSPG